MTEDNLPCGVPFDEILDQVTDHRPPRDPRHQATCPTCRATLAELGDVWSLMDELAAQPVQAPTHLLHAVMDRIRELSAQPWYAVLTTPQGDTKIAARVVGALARLAAEDVPEVSLALGGGHHSKDQSLAEVAGPSGEAATDVGVSGTHVVVDIDVIADLGTHLPHLADQVRARIHQDIASYTGLTVAEVNVNIVDVLTTERID